MFVTAMRSGSSCSPALQIVEFLLDYGVDINQVLLYFQSFSCRCVTLRLFQMMINSCRLTSRARQHFTKAYSLTALIVFTCFFAGG